MDRVKNPFTPNAGAEPDVIVGREDGPARSIQNEGLTGGLGGGRDRSQEARRRPVHE